MAADTLPPSSPAILAAQEAPGDDAAPQAFLPEAIEELIALYFACDDAQERDYMLQQLADRQEPEALDFLQAMMVRDEDPFLRLGAAKALAMRGDAQALQSIAQMLAVCSDDLLFVEAVDAYVSCAPGEACAELQAIFEDPWRDPHERQQAALGMSRCDPAAARSCFLAAIDKMQTPADVDFDALETMLLAFVDTDASQAITRLEALCQRLQNKPTGTAASTATSADEVQDVCASVRGLIATLAADTQFSAAAEAGG